MVACGGRSLAHVLPSTSNRNFMGSKFHEFREMGVHREIFIQNATLTTHKNLSALFYDDSLLTIRCFITEIMQSKLLQYIYRMYLLVYKRVFCL